MKKNYQMMDSELEIFLKTKMTWEEFEKLPENLGISKKMLTMYFRNPERIPTNLLFQLSEISQIHINEFINILK